MVHIYGQVVDQETRCVHYHSSEDIIAIKFKCCQKYYPCYQCHQHAESHPIEVWPKDQFNQKAILCGVCKTEFTIEQYLHINQCTDCGSVFNDGCRLHHHLYFKGTYKTRCLWITK
ncbi:CHY zinc finger protein [Virgibacillus pantothenticus]|uniref:CHY zinc finger protein n=1 Tax=Virgibacillus pantothenticus TaxID=1473 RepID=UPI000985B9BB|nr:CHY zinc finger protein [Virgibacillus pantothenticus]